MGPCGAGRGNRRRNCQDADRIDPCQAADRFGGWRSLLIWLDPDRLWTMGTLGGPPRFISNDHDATLMFSFPAWSPDTKYIAYSDSHGELTMRSDGTDVRKLATFKGEITDLAWSPDGGRIRFTWMTRCGKSPRQAGIFTPCCRTGRALSDSAAAGGLPTGTSTCFWQGATLAGAYRRRLRADLGT